MKKPRGFTLIELLVVISIIALLSGVVLASLNAARAKARDAQRAAWAQQMANAVALYAYDHGGFLPDRLRYSNSYSEPYYPSLDMSASGNLNFAVPMLSYIQPANDPRWASGGSSGYYYYVVRPNSSWITTNGSWARLTSDCTDKPIIVVRQTETSGNWRQDCQGADSNMIIISVE